MYFHKNWKDLYPEVGLGVSQVVGHIEAGLGHGVGITSVRTLIQVSELTLCVKFEKWHGTTG